MKRFGECNDCNPCNRRPACSDICVSLAADPFRDDIWNFSFGGELFPLKVPEVKNIDTTLSVNTSNGTLNYTSEYHTDTITGDQLGKTLKLGDLADVNPDYDTESMCFELIYHKYGECGEGCQSLENAWSTFSIANEGALQNNIRFVRGVNRYGCPEYLNVPSNEGQYWYGGWRPNGQFGYYQAAPVTDLPKDSNGNYIIMSQDPNTKQPVVGTLPLQCILNNLLSNFGVLNEIKFNIIKGTPRFGATINQATGAFDIEWNDWYNNFTRHVGTGHIYGKVNWEYTFDANTGNMTYKVQSVYFNKVVYTTRQGAPSTAQPLFLTLKGIPLGGSGAQVTVVDKYQYTGSANWTININQYVEGGQTFTLTPGQSMGPFNFLYMFNDWERDFDDEAYMTITFTNNLNNWSAC